MAICVVIAVAISALFVIRKVNYNNGKEQGYILGYHPSGWYPFLIVQDAVTEDLIIPHRVAPLAEKADGMVRRDRGTGYSCGGRWRRESPCRRSSVAGHFTVGEPGNDGA